MQAIQLLCWKKHFKNKFEHVSPCLKSVNGFSLILDKNLNSQTSLWEVHHPKPPIQSFSPEAYWSRWFIQFIKLWIYPMASGHLYMLFPLVETRFHFFSWVNPRHLRDFSLSVNLRKRSTWPKVYMDHMTFNFIYCLNIYISSFNSPWSQNCIIWTYHKSVVYSK